MKNKEISMLSEREWQLWYKNNQDKIWKRDNFDFNQRVESLKDVSKVIDETGLKAYFANGVLLGAYRNNDFIPWDDDIDFDCLAPDFLDVCSAAQEEFINLGYIARLNTQQNKAKLNIYKNLEKISFAALYDLSDEYYFRYRYKWPKVFYQKPENINFKGLDFMCPSPIEEYLVHCYGSDWMIPKKSDNKETTFSRELFLK
jgi:phosphorylcholine metabolism protein LicD